MFRANKKNLELIERYRQAPGAPLKPFDYVVVGLTFVILIALLALPIVVSVFLIGTLIQQVPRRLNERTVEAGRPSTQRLARLPSAPSTPTSSQVMTQAVNGDTEAIPRMQALVVSKLTASIPQGSSSSGPASPRANVRSSIKTGNAIAAATIAEMGAKLRAPTMSPMASTTASPSKVRPNMTFFGRSRPRVSGFGFVRDDSMRIG